MNFKNHLFLIVSASLVTSSSFAIEYCGTGMNQLVHATVAAERLSEERVQLTKSILDCSREGKKISPMELVIASQTLNDKNKDVINSFTSRMAELNKIGASDRENIRQFLIQDLVSSQNQHQANMETLNAAFRVGMTTPKN